MLNPKSEQHLLTNAQLLTLACLISSGEIDSTQYLSWAEKKTIEADSPPYWILQLVSEIDPRKAAEIVLQEASYVMEGRRQIFEWGGLEIALLFLRHRKNVISWKDFLRGAIRISSHKPSPWTANDFQRFHDAYLANGKCSSIAHNQAELVEQVLDEEIVELSSLAGSFPLEDIIVSNPNRRLDNAT